MPRLSSTVTAALVTLSVASSTACSTGEPQQPVSSLGTTSQRLDGSEQKPQAYRHYVAARGKGGVRVKAGVFDGLILLPELDHVLEVAKKEGRYDAYGNLVTGWMRDGRSSRSVVVAPKGRATNVLTLADDGTITSSIDLDGDGVVDVVDLLRPGMERHVFLTEHHGVAAFAAWLRGANPLCQEPFIKELGPGAFGCAPDEEASSSGGVGGGLGVPRTRGSLDPIDDMCEGMTSKGPGFRPGVMAHGGHGYGSVMRWSIVDNPNDRNDRAIFTRMYYDTEGNHVSTYRSIYERNEDGSPRREVHERVDHEGRGTRRVVEHGADGTTKTREEEITATLDAEGHIQGTDPPAFQGDTPPPPIVDDDGSGAGPVEESVGTPGPSGNEPDPEAALAEFCKRRAADNRSGAERATDTDHRDMSMDCDDPVTNPNPVASDGDARDCGFGTVERSDVLGVLVTGTNCGPYAQPGADGTCGAGTRIDQLRGGAAWIGMADIAGLPICNPLVCRPF